MAEHKIVFLERESIRGDFRRPDFPHDYTEYPVSYTHLTLPTSDLV